MLNKHYLYKRMRNTTSELTFITNWELGRNDEYTQNTVQQSIAK